MAVPALFMNLTMVTELCSIGTLFAFVLVCGGVLMLQNRTDIPRGTFKTPYLNGKFIMPVLLVIAVIVSFTSYKSKTMDFITNKESIKSKDEIIHGLNPNEILSLKNHLFQTDRTSFIQSDATINTFYEKMPVTRLVS